MKFLTAFLGRRILGLAVGTWLKGIAAAAVFGAMAWLGYQYNEGQRAMERAEQLEQTLTEERARFVEELEASEEENQRARERHARELADVDRAFDKERQRLLEAADLLSEIDRAPAADDGPVAPVLQDLLEQLP